MNMPTYMLQAVMI